MPLDFDLSWAPAYLEQIHCCLDDLGCCAGRVTQQFLRKLSLSRLGVAWTVVIDLNGSCDFFHHRLRVISNIRAADELW